MRRAVKWELVTHNGREYAKYGSHLFKCCIKSIAPSDWVYIKDIHRCVSYKCF